LDEDEEGQKFQFVLSEEMHKYFSPLPEANNKEVLLSKETLKKTKKIKLENTLQPIHIGTL
jgi:hypothetical protein